MNNIQRLLDLMATLRDPHGGCPWDKEQTFSTIAPCTIEEAYEVADAIERGDLLALKDELGDLLFQVVFHSRLAEEQGEFAFGEVITAICEKMERRHPHVFGADRIDSADQQTVAWEEHKKRERSANQQNSSVLDNVPVALPALTRAAKLGRRAASVGFEWPEVQGALDKLDEEIQEVHKAIATDAPTAELEDELGDLLFCVVNVCRHLKVDPEAALRRVNAKFERRFRHIETRLHAQDKRPEQVTLAEMDALWDEAKRLERSGR